MMFAILRIASEALSYGVSPDGQRILLTKRTSAGDPTRLHLVTNLFQELLARETSSPISEMGENDLWSELQRLGVSQERS
jgi:hypothetical protein